MRHRSNSSFFTEGSLYHDPPDTFNYKKYFDKDSFPGSTGLSIVDWREFTRDFLSLDIKLSKITSHICESNLDKLIDMRPYMIENPEVCTSFDFFPKILNRFRYMHLRHLIVVNPSNNHIEGIITRQDVFKYMPL